MDRQSEASIKLSKPSSLENRTALRKAKASVHRSTKELSPYVRVESPSGGSHGERDILTT
jgi:hypothetical protein